MILDSESIESYRLKFVDVYLLVFHRSVEKALSENELFDILSDIPDYPIVWDEDTRRWMTTADLVQFDKFEKR